MDQLINNQMAWEGQQPEAGEAKPPGQSGFPARAHSDPQLAVKLGSQGGSTMPTLPTRLRRQSGSFKFDDVRLAMVADPVLSPHMSRLRQSSAFGPLATDNDEQQDIAVQVHVH